MDLIIKQNPSNYPYLLTRFSIVKELISDFLFYCYCESEWNHIDTDIIFNEFNEFQIYLFSSLLGSVINNLSFLMFSVSQKSLYLAENSTGFKNSFSESLEHISYQPSSKKTYMATH